MCQGANNNAVLVFSIGFQYHSPMNALYSVNGKTENTAENI